MPLALRSLADALVRHAAGPTVRPPPSKMTERGLFLIEICILVWNLEETRQKQVFGLADHCGDSFKMFKNASKAFTITVQPMNKRRKGEGGVSRSIVHEENLLNDGAVAHLRP